MLPSVDLVRSFHLIRPLPVPLPSLVNSQDTLSLPSMEFLGNIGGGVPTKSPQLPECVDISDLQPPLVWTDLDVLIGNVARQLCRGVRLPGRRREWKSGTFHHPTLAGPAVPTIYPASTQPFCSGTSWYQPPTPPLPLPLRLFPCRSQI